MKIGISIDAKKRIARISATSGRAIVRTYISPRLPMVDELERVLHKQFRAERGVGEWFDISFDDAVRAARLTGAMISPGEWRASEDYMRGALCRERMRKFTNPDRSVAEWDAFFAGMGQQDIDLVEFAEQTDMQIIKTGFGKLVEKLVSVAPMAAALGISLAPPPEIEDRMKELRAQIDADLKEAGLSPSSQSS